MSLHHPFKDAICDICRDFLRATARQLRSGEYVIESERVLHFQHWCVSLRRCGGCECQEFSQSQSCFTRKSTAKSFSFLQIARFSSKVTGERAVFSLAHCFGYDAADSLVDSTTWNSQKARVYVSDIRNRFATSMGNQQTLAVLKKEPGAPDSNESYVYPKDLDTHDPGEWLRMRNDLILAHASWLWSALLLCGTRQNMGQDQE